MARMCCGFVCFLLIALGILCAFLAYHFARVVVAAQLVGTAVAIGGLVAACQTLNDGFIVWARNASLCWALLCSCE